MEGDTPFLLSKSFLRAIDADVCTRMSVLRLNQLDVEVPLKLNTNDSKGLLVVQLAEVISAFNREHQCQNLEIVTNVITEDKQTALQPMEASGVAKVAQHPVSSKLSSDVANVGDGIFQESNGSAGWASMLARRPHDDLHDQDGRGEDQPPTRSDKSSTVGSDDASRRQTQEQDVPGGGQYGWEVRQMDEEAPGTSQRLGSVVPELCQSMGSKSGTWPIGGSRCQAEKGGMPKKMESAHGWRDGEAELIVIEEDNQRPVMMMPKAMGKAGKLGMNMQAEVNEVLVMQLRQQIALLQDQLDQVTKNTNH